MTKGRIVQLIAIALISLIILNVVPFPREVNAGDLVYVVNGIVEVIQIAFKGGY